MIRVKSALLLSLLMLLGGCVTYPTYSYRDDGYGREVRYVGDGSYYADADDYYGDYYYGGYRYASTGYRYYAPDYVSYSAYYSMFWPLHRWYHDPYWHPGFYYGVTYFPRNYFSLSFHSGYRSQFSLGWSSGGYWPYYGYSHWYSPYRHSWADSYYDWDRYRFQYRENRTGHGHFSSSLYAPRYGHARNQAERLAALEPARSASYGEDTRNLRGRGGLLDHNDPRGFDPDRVDTPTARGADYRSRSSLREPLATDGFGVPRAQSRPEPTPRSASIRGAGSLEDDSALVDRDASLPQLRRSRSAEHVERDSWREYQAPAEERSAPRYRGSVQARDFDAGPVGGATVEPRSRAASASRLYSTPETYRSPGPSASPRIERADSLPERQSYENRAYDRSQRSYRGAVGMEAAPRYAPSPEPTPAHNPRSEYRNAPAPRGDFGGEAREFHAPRASEAREARGDWGGAESSAPQRSAPEPAPSRERSSAREALHFD
jgi:hypothetical protein